MEVRDVLPRDAIPSVDDPEFVAEYDGDPSDEVIVLDWADPPRAYPIRYLHYHEVVNDVVPTSREAAPVAADDGPLDAADLPPATEAATTSYADPVAVTWCPLCGSAVVFDRVVAAFEGDRQLLTFGVSGKLADDDLVLYDRETDSEWKQSLGRAIAGELEGVDLSVRPAGMTTWRAFREAYPDGVVLAPPGGASEAGSDTDDPVPVDYDAAPYDEYFAGETYGLGAHRGTGGRDDWDRDDLAPKTVVVGLTDGDEAVAVPVPTAVREGGAVTVTVGDGEVVVFATDDGVHAYESPGFDFERPDDADAGGDRFRGDGATWSATSGESDDGRRLDRSPARRLFAFAWQDDHGPDAFYGLD
jgi:hypothetical protein